MKKLLSIILATVMLISLIPAVFAADTEVTVKYDFEGKFEFGEKYADLTYGVCGNWAYADNSKGYTEMDSEHGGVRANSSGNIRVNGGTTTGDYWIAFKLKIDTATDYSMKIEVAAAANATYARIDTYIFKTDTVSSVRDGMTEVNKLSASGLKENATATTLTLGTETQLPTGKKPFEEGEYYFVFRPVTTNTNKSCGWVTLYSLTLEGTVSEPEVTPEYEEAFGEDTYETEENVNVDTKVKVVAYANGETLSQETTSATKNGDVYEIKTDATIGDYTFRYWARGLEDASKGNKRIVSLENNFTYSAEKGDANWLIAVYTKDGEAAEKEYFNANGQLIPDATEETQPYLLGYGYATGWKDNGNGIMEAVYEDGVQKYDITVNGVPSSYEYGKEIKCPTVTASENQFFWGWTKKVGNAEAELVSTDMNYTFYAWENCVVEPLFGDSELVRGDIIARKILISSLDIDNGESVIKAEFIGFDDAVERGITLDSKDYAMTRDDAKQFAIINNVGATEIFAYAILNDGTKYIYTYVAPEAE